MEVTHFSDTGVVKIVKFDSVEKAPNYVKEGGYKALELVDVAIVENGTVNGNPTVDLIFKDSDGNKYVTMVMGSLIHAMKSVVGDLK